MRGDFFTGRSGSLLIDLFGQLLEGFRLLYGELGEHLAIELYALRFGRGDKSAIGEPEFSERVPEADDPESAEGALLVSTVSTCVFSSLDESFLGGDEVRLAAPAETDGFRQYVLSSLVCGDAAFYSCHKNRITNCELRIANRRARTMCYEFFLILDS